MAGKRLEYWSTLPKAVLQERVDQELSRSHLTVVEQQLLDAALERLRNWREPMRGSRKKEIAMDQEGNHNTPTPDAPAPDKKEEKTKVRKSKSTAKAKAKGKAKAKAKTPAKKSAAASNSNGRAPRIDPEAKVFKTNKENPYREGTAVFKRVETVLKSSGQTAGAIAKKSGIKPTTLGNMRRLGLIRIEAA